MFPQIFEDRETGVARFLSISKKNMPFTSGTQTAAYTGFAVVFPFMQCVYTQLVPALVLLYVVVSFRV